MWGQEKHIDFHLKHQSKYSGYIPRNPMAPPVTQPLYTAFFQSDLPLCCKSKNRYKVTHKTINKIYLHCNRLDEWAVLFCFVQSSTHTVSLKIKTAASSWAPEGAIRPFWGKWQNHTNYHEVQSQTIIMVYWCYDNNNMGIIIFLFWAWSQMIYEALLDYLCVLFVYNKSRYNTALKSIWTHNNFEQLIKGDTHRSKGGSYQFPC